MASIKHLWCCVDIFYLWCLEIYSKHWTYGHAHLFSQLKLYYILSSDQSHKIDPRDLKQSSNPLVHTYRHFSNNMKTGPGYISADFDIKC